MNTKAIHHLFRAAKPTFNENADGGVFLITSSIAVRDGLRWHSCIANKAKGLHPVGSSIAYSVTKAAGKRDLASDVLEC